MNKKWISVVLSILMVLTLLSSAAAAVTRSVSTSIRVLEPQVPIRLLNTTAPLSGIAFSNSMTSRSKAILSPAFSSSVYSYTVTPPKGAKTLEIVPATGQPTYTYSINVNGVAASSNKPIALHLTGGETSVEITVSTLTAVFTYDLLVVVPTLSTCGSEITPSIHQSGRSFYYSGKLTPTSEPAFLKKTGSSSKKLSNDEPLWIQSVGNVLVYSNLKDNWNLYRMNNDGSNRVMLVDAGCYGLTISNGSIYFGNLQSGALYRVGLNGLNLKALTSNNAHNLNVYNGWVYYVNGSDNNRIYRVRIDGQGNTALSTDGAVDLNLYNNALYYSNFNDNRTLYKVNLDGSGRTKLNSVPSFTMTAANGWLYFGNGSNSSVLSAIKMDGSGMKTISNQITQIDSIRYANGYLYVQTEEGFLARIKPNGTGFVANWQP